MLLHYLREFKKFKTGRKCKQKYHMFGGTFLGHGVFAQIELTEVYNITA